jgi:hypothetical protein
LPTIAPDASPNDAATPHEGGPESGGPTNLAATAVGAYQQVGSSCSQQESGYVLFLCPGGELRGGGNVTNGGPTLAQIDCGTFMIASPSFSGCTDKQGCFPKITASVKDTIGAAGVTSTTTATFTYLQRTDVSGEPLQWLVSCANGSVGYVNLQRVPGTVMDNYCNSVDCPQPGGATGGAGSCGADCDCGTCWYCESGSCHYGGQSSAGICYRGCQ